MFFCTPQNDVQCIEAALVSYQWMWWSLENSSVLVSSIQTSVCEMCLIKSSIIDCSFLLMSIDYTTKSSSFIAKPYKSQENWPCLYVHTLSGTASISTLHDDADYDDDALSTIMMIERLALPGPDGGTTSMQANASGSLEGWTFFLGEPKFSVTPCGHNHEHIHEHNTKYSEGVK